MFLFYPPNVSAPGQRSGVVESYVLSTFSSPSKHLKNH